ncbi:unnamed protein product, partial [Meganyctiphanes norvegica]
GLSTNEHEESNDCLEESDGSEQLLHPDSPPSSSIKDAGKKVITYRAVQTKIKPRTFVRPSVIAAQQHQVSSGEATTTEADRLSALPVTEQTINYPAVISEIDWPSGQAATMDRLLGSTRVDVVHVLVNTILA